MIKLFKNDVPLKEFFSVYNTIEYLQNILTDSAKSGEPLVLYSNNNTVSFEMNGIYKVEFITEKQTHQVLKWIDSFVYERPTTL